MYSKFLKPVFDFVAALLGLVLLAPFLLLLTLILAWNMGGNPFFIQARTGKNLRLFNIVKFKTMNDLRDPQGKLLPDAERLTTLGRLIRKTSLDEIPQLLNVLKGDMSLIGPRPLLTNYVHLYSDFQNRRHLVKPGISGWAQVNGRNAISWEEKFTLDVWYVEHISFWLDVKILWKTVLKVLQKEGINAAHAATIEPFDGN